MLLTLSVALLFALVVLSANDAEACGRRRRRRRTRVIVWQPPSPPFTFRPPPVRNPPPPVTRPPPTPAPTPPTPAPTRGPTRSPTPQPTSSPTTSPTKSPTTSPTPSPTPPPPPPPHIGIVPTPPTVSTPYMTRSTCTKSVEFSVPQMVGQLEVKEQWVYSCEYKVYVTIDVSTINEPTPCACGIALSAPPKHVLGNVETEYATSVPSATIVIYDERRNKVLGELSQFEFKVNNATKDLLAMGASSGNFQGAVAGFSGIVEPFPDMPALLDNNVAGQEDNVAALCFTVVQRFRSSYQWPEPPFPSLHTPPNVYKSDCISWVPENPHSYKRHEQDAEQATTLWFREFLVFADTSVSRGGFNPRNRYITSYYTNSACSLVSGYVSFDRHFVSTMQRTSEAHGVFQWRRDYTDVKIVGGVPSDIAQETNFFTDGYYKITWRQPYSVDDAGAFRPGVLAANLLGEEHASDPNSVGGRFKLCSSVPAAWKTCTPGTTACAVTGNADQKDNDVSTYVWPTPQPNQDAAVKQQLDALRCTPAFTQCASETTWLAFQNFGSFARDFSKTPTAKLLTGRRDFFCNKVREVEFDTLRFTPHTLGKAIRRRKRFLLANDEHQNHDFDVAGARKRGTTVLDYARDPIAAALPTVQDTTLRPAVGSSGPDGTNAANSGDHPVELFPEQFTVPMSVREEDKSCGAEYGRGTVDTSGCEAQILAGAPPCIKGQLGCSCRTIANRAACDAPLECVANGSGASFCLKKPCPDGQTGCACDATGSCEAGAKCGPDGRCFTDIASCPEGELGCLCKPANQLLPAAAQERCNSATSACVAEVCVDVSGTCTAGARGCECTAAGGCGNDAADVCQPEINQCVSRAYCERGSGGCVCAAGAACAAGYECVEALNQCAQPKCPPGDRSCPCNADRSCNEAKYQCVELTVDGSQSACLAEIKCGSQQARCDNYCGPMNVQYCPACDHEIPQCFVDVTIGSGASALSASLLALFAVLAATLAL